jgi:nucleoside-diphosphate-sugar epimerase
MRVLVTGATGFIGWHTARRLCEAGHEVRALVRDADKATRCLGPLGLDASGWVVGDMTDSHAVGRALEGCDAAIHAAANVSVTQAAGDDAFEQNVDGARTVLSSAVEAGISPIVFMSSLTAIFDPRGGETSADSPLVESHSRYGRSKASSDAFARELQSEGAPIAIVYPSGVIGPDDPGLSESVRAYRSFLRNTIRAGGTNLVDARDLAELLLQLVERDQHGRFVAAGHYFSWDDLTELIEQVTGARIARLSAPGWLLRAAGSVCDGVGQLTGRSLPMSREGMEIATRWRPIADSPGIAELGVEWRPARETLEDMYRWLVERGRLPASAAPGLLESGPSGDPVTSSSRIEQ